MGKPLPKLAPRRAPEPDDAAKLAFIGESAPSPAVASIQATPAPPADSASAPPTASSRAAAPPPSEPSASVPTAAPPPAPELIAASSSPAGRTTVQRKDGRALSRKTIYMPRKLGTRLAVYAAENGLDQSEIVSAALAEWLDAKGA